MNKLFPFSRQQEQPRTSEIAMPQFMHSAQNSKDGFSPAPANKYKECESTIHHGAWLGEEVKRTDYMLLNVTILFILSAIIMGMYYSHVSCFFRYGTSSWMRYGSYNGFFITLILVASALAFVRLHFYLKSRGYNLLLRTGLELEYHKVVGSTPPQDPKDHGHHGDQEGHHHGNEEVHRHGNEEVHRHGNDEVHLHGNQECSSSGDRGGRVRDRERERERDVVTARCCTQDTGYQGWPHPTPHSKHLDIVCQIARSEGYESNKTLLSYLKQSPNFFPARVNAEGIHPDAFLNRNGHKIFWKNKIGCNTFSCEDNGVAPSAIISMGSLKKFSSYTAFTQTLLI
eukprot:sb/3466393/